ncbi:GntR family transcriptional regulator [Planomonospora venezuelensis]|uniref:GntR family transcriptional regulator n=1 Tax=Planomonospora venezuelensis TaxID=1999 RepID=A0A841CY62_PLAVE|nr:GntR family transcriptional regulator [Planomonospora venezuelensis]MBB5960885.1 GntR family transcriptional regulator [Planomonospora venezuelensis]GIN01119.1 GntR family transcriptional regulator [Planomonospora venezuelensis]
MSTALFSRIANDLRDDIVTGRFTSGEQLPSENELTTRYNTTRATVRKALAVLRSEGHIVSSQGSGSYVRPRSKILVQSTGAVWRDRRSTGLSNFNAEMTANGLDVEQQLLEVTTLPASAEVAERLQIAENEPVILRRRLFMVDGEPVQRSDGYYPAVMFASTPIAEHHRIRGGVASYIEDVMGRRIARFIEQLGIRMPLPDESATLKIGPGVPVARVRRLAVDVTGLPVELLDSIAVGDRHVFEYVIDVMPPDD